MNVTELLLVTVVLGAVGTGNVLNLLLIDGVVLGTGARQSNQPSPPP